MVTISVVLTLYLPAAHSLKEKRAVVRSLVERMRARLDVSAAEVGAHDLTTARRLADDAERFADRELLGRAEVIDRTVEEYVLDLD